MNYTLDQMYLADIYRTIYSIVAKHTFFSSAHETYTRLERKFLKTEVISDIFSRHNGMKLKISNRRKARTFTNMWKLNITPLNNQWIKEEIKEETFQCQNKQK